MEKSNADKFYSLNQGITEFKEPKYAFKSLMQGFGKSATFEINLLSYTNFDNEKFEYMYNKYTISEIAYFIALKRVSVISQITT